MFYKGSSRLPSLSYVQQDLADKGAYSWSDSDIMYDYAILSIY